MKNQRDGFCPAMIEHMAASLIQPVASSMINSIIEKGIMRAEKGQAGGIFSLFLLFFMMKVLGKGVTRAGIGYNKMHHMNKNF